MKQLTILLLTIIIFFSPLVCSFAQTVSDETGKDAKMLWFADAKLGIFIHWGIYSLGNTSESWEFHNKRISHADYMSQLNSFTAKSYNPEYWADLIKRSGARYSVITSKHHDGVALWDTKMNDLSTLKKTPAKRDVLTPFVNELRKNGIKVGLYYSLIDWSYPDYPGFLKDSSRYDAVIDPIRWGKFLKFCHGQVEEIVKKYNPDLVWFDGDWEHSAGEWRADYIRKIILDNNKNTIINGRLQGYGDYDTPEQNFPVSRPNLKYWELCMTTNESWGFYRNDKNYKTPYEIITIFADAISMGGNLLLDIAPDEEGTIPIEQVNILTELGKWTNKHSEAIFGTLGGMPQGHFYGPSTISKDSTSLFLFLPGKVTGDVVVKGLMNNIKKISEVGSGTLLQPKVVGKISWSTVPGLVYINVPESVQDTYMTVLKIELDKPIKLYRGKGGFN
ncbi:MAG: alpha-L-fucosidase [Bacteroidales bacterium]|nr:MAG: alpha-L-fucosidase [Bacteroidales bacterium]